MVRNISQWVEYIQTLHSREIDMTLDRVSEAYKRLFPEGIDYKIISIAGTNGKGSTAELLSSIYCKAGYKVAKFTSPHILTFNERFNLNGENVSNELLLDAFEEIEKVRGDITITYFEYCFLLAVVLFARNKVDLAIMEVGLGGRLDATNVLNADISVVTNISIDHVDWLGDSLDGIAMEKVGIARTNKPCVMGMPQPPKVMLQYCEDNKIPVSQLDSDFNYQLNEGKNEWRWENNKISYHGLPLPFAQNNIQLQNAAGVLQAVDLFQLIFPVTEIQLRNGISAAKLSGRCQVIGESPLIVVDVSHNEESVACLAHFLQQKINEKSSSGKVYAVCGMLQDKKIEQSLEHLTQLIDQWHVTAINHERGSTAEQIKEVVDGLSGSKNDLPLVVCYEDVTIAFDRVKQQLNSGDCLVVFGSFFIVSDIIAHIKNTDPLN